MFGYLLGSGQEHCLILYGQYMSHMVNTDFSNCFVKREPLSSSCQLGIK